MQKIFEIVRRWWAFFAFLLSVVFPLTALFLFMSLWGCSPAWACPMFVEFFPDPVAVSDQAGEFVEIRLRGATDLPEEAGAFDSLVVQFEGKAALAFPYPRGKRFVLVHDSASCPKVGAVDCGLLGNLSLPNSRESTWRLWAVGKVLSGSMVQCRDSVLLPTPKAGASIQRVKETSRWVVAEPTFGAANSRYELDVQDCGIGPVEGEGWFSLTGCDSAYLRYQVRDLFEQKNLTDSAWIFGRTQVHYIQGKALWINGVLPEDDFPGNDSLDTLLVQPGFSPVVISEVHHCPQEPEPEWVEVYNRTAYPLPLRKFRFCGRGGEWVQYKPEGDSIAPFQSVILTKDSSSLREFLGYGDVRIIQVALGYLNNSTGSLSVCFGNDTLETVSWDKSTVACPQGFSPLTGKAEHTPGFQKGGQTLSDAPFIYKLSSRVVQREKVPLRVYVESETPVELKLLDSADHMVWRQDVPGGSRNWWNVPLEGMPRMGVGYLSLSSGKYMKIVGFILRP